MQPCRHPNPVELSSQKGKKKKGELINSRWYWCPDCGSIRFLSTLGKMDPWRKPKHKRLKVALEELAETKGRLTRCRRVISNLRRMATKEKKEGGVYRGLSKENVSAVSIGLHRAAEMLKKAIR